jgi:uncharacterized protein YydD (DUF2326 family)
VRGRYCRQDGQTQITSGQRIDFPGRVSSQANSVARFDLDDKSLLKISIEEIAKLFDNVGSDYPSSVITRFNPVKMD